MPSKEFLLDGGLPVTIYKRKSSRNLRLSIASSGQVRVSIPAWAPYRAGLEFARSRQAWITAQHRPPSLLQAGQPIGKAHHLEFAVKPGISATTTRIKGSAVTVSHPPSLVSTDVEVQAAARKAGVKALRAQAEQLLPQRLATLSAKHGLSYRSVGVKQLKSRWGSCDQDKNIVLNLFLMQLPWELIDYVLLHELAHTVVLRHGPDFWAAMEAILPGAKAARKQLRDFQPVLNSIG